MMEGGVSGCAHETRRRKPRKERNKLVVLLKDFIMTPPEVGSHLIPKSKTSEADSPVSPILPAKAKPITLGRL
jgi:hypothetical protein